MLNKDYRDILQIFLKNEVKFLVVGAYAMGAYGYPRATSDIDLYVQASIQNSQKVYDSLVEFGAAVDELTPDTLAKKGIFFQIGVAPRRIDILTDLDGVDFDRAYETRKIVEVETLPIPIISKQDLIKNKKIAGRNKDVEDLKALGEQ
jgi:hypothetical protein